MPPGRAGVYHYRVYIIHNTSGKFSAHPLLRAHPIISKPRSVSLLVVSYEMEPPFDLYDTFDTTREVRKMFIIYDLSRASRKPEFFYL